jgi:hypothetical protein
LAATAKRIIERRLIGGIGSRPLDGRVEAAHFAIQPIAEFVLERVDLSAGASDRLMARDPSWSKHLPLKVCFDRKFACSAIS